MTGAAVFGRRPFAATVLFAATFLNWSAGPPERSETDRLLDLDACAGPSRLAAGADLRSGFLKPGAFAHSRHVSTAWIDADDSGKFAFPETARDCGGCHRFAMENGRETSSDPQDACALCHYPADKSGAATLTLKAPRTSWPALSAELRAPDAKPATFNHPDHAGVACRDCHIGKKSVDGFVSDRIPVPQGTKWCIDCHDPTLDGRDTRAFRGDAFARMVKTLNASPRMAHADAFRHDEHYQVDAAEAGSRCGDCHDLAGSTVESLGEREYAPSSCRPCHVALDLAAPIVFDERVEKRPSKAALCFDHGDHLTPRALADPVMAERCFACHVDDRVDYALKPGFGAYAECAKCHERVLKDGARAKAAGLAVAALPPDAPGHGRWSDPAEWGKCQLCHALGAAADPAAPRRKMKDNRPLATKARPRAGLFRITSQRHPHVTSVDGAPIHGRCAECHVAGLTELPSRVIEARFSHATHLAKTPPADEHACATCHRTTVNGTEKSDDIGRSYDAASCKTCHLGAEPVELPPAVDPARAAPPIDFNHKLHLSKDRPGETRKMNCRDCHDLYPATEGAPLGVKPGAVSCTDCHRHDSERAAHTGGKDAAYVLGCEKCHQRYVPVREEKPPEVVRRRIVGLKSGVQAHTAATAERCGGCHKLATKGATSLREIRVHATADPESPHKASAAAGAPRYPAGVSCASCHWHDWSSYANKGELSGDLKGKSLKDVRGAQGAELNGFPGAGRR
jgi:hypothetical protein